MSQNDNLLLAARCALADLEGIMPDFEPSGDREHPAWETIKLLRSAVHRKKRIRSNFESPSEAIEYCRSQSDPWETMWDIAKACVEADEFGFASELVYESQSLYD